MLQGIPAPPHAQSMVNGLLKDTPANRALSTESTPQSVFAAKAVLDKTFYHDEKTLLFQGDTRHVLRMLARRKILVDCIVTSPPFYGQRDYGVSGQIGLERHPKYYLAMLLKVFDLCRPLLRDTGSLWVNLGDTYWSGKGAHKSKELKQSARRFGLRPQDAPGDGKWARPKQQLLIPHRFAIAMQERGWLVRNDNVWVKPNPIPDQVRDRCSASHEYVFHFTKSRWYYFNRQAVGRTTSRGRVLPPRDTWVVAPSKGRTGTHRATFSSELVRIPIEATTPPDGIVLDPFNGSGTTTLFAAKHGLRSIGIDLSEEYCKHASKALQRVHDGR